MWEGNVPVCHTGTVPPGPNSPSQEVQTPANHDPRPQHVAGQNAKGEFLGFSPGCTLLQPA